MRYQSIELNKFKRFSLNTIDHFKLNADDRIQIILGTNGCGKSQFLGELSPMPAISGNFHKGGGKKQVIEYRGSVYKLSSQFETNGKDVHSFVKDDGEEQNPGGTVTVQRKLVQEAFGINQDVHDLMTGQLRFSQMKAPERREWLTRLCEQDYTYALAVYNKAAVRHRDIQGALKLAKKRLVQERFRAADKVEIDILQKNIDTLADEHSHLLMLRGRSDNEQSKNDSWNRITVLEQETAALFEKYKALRKNVNWTTFVSPEEMTTDLIGKQAELRGMAERVVELTAEHDSLVQELEVASKKEVGTDLHQRRKDLVDRKQSLRGARNFQYNILDHGDPMTPIPKAGVALETLNGVMGKLTDIFSKMPADPERKWTASASRQLIAKIDTLKNEAGKTDVNIQRLEHEVKHLEQLRDKGMIDCPECKHTFAPGFDPNKLAKYQELMTRGQKHWDKQKAEIKKLSEEYEVCKAYLDIWNEMEWIRRSAMAILPLFHSFGDSLWNAPSNCMITVMQYHEDIKTMCEIEGIDVEIARVDDLLVLAQRASEVDVQGTVKRATAIEAELTRITQAQSILQVRVNKTQEALNAGMKVLEMGDVFKRLGETYDAQVKLYLQAHVNEELDRQIRERSGRLAGLRHELTKFSELASVVESIEKDIARMEVQEAAMKLAMESLSPSEGLIAEGLFGFMKNLVKKMNIVIRGIWSYGMEVQCCSLSDDGTADLDYKFPMLITSTDSELTEPVPDISKGSAGQQEVVDLAFKIVAMRYLGLSDAPLILDEFGARFDKQHRIAATSTIKTLMEELPFSQLWMVSHYEESYMCFPSAQICVINATNIVTPGEGSYNNHVEMV